MLGDVGTYQLRCPDYPSLTLQRQGGVVSPSCFNDPYRDDDSTFSAMEKIDRFVLAPVHQDPLEGMPIAEVFQLISCATVNTAVCVYAAKPVTNEGTLLRMQGVRDLPLRLQCPAYRVYRK